MQIDARAVANFFIDKAKGAERQPDLVALQNLTYLAHGWFLGLTEEPLISSEILAWEHGAYISDIANDVRFSRKLHSVHRKFWKLDGDSGQLDLCLEQCVNEKRLEEIKTFLESIWTGYGQFSTRQLVDFVRGDTAWRAAIQQASHRMSDALILKHFRSLVEGNKEQPIEQFAAS